jgi:hypothetical protein
MIYSTFLRSEWSIVRSELLAKGGTLEKRPSLHLHKVLTLSNKVSPQTLQTFLVQWMFLTGETNHIQLNSMNYKKKWSAVLIETWTINIRSKQ